MNVKCRSADKPQSSGIQSENNTSRCFNDKLCNYCKKESHLRSECFKLKNKPDEQKKVSLSVTKQ